jgi:hypothetical protein
MITLRYSESGLFNGFETHKSRNCSPCELVNCQGVECYSCALHGLIKKEYSEQDVVDILEGCMANEYK